MASAICCVSHLGDKHARPHKSARQRCGCGGSPRRRRRNVRGSHRKRVQRPGKSRHPYIKPTRRHSVDPVPISTVSHHPLCRARLVRSLVAAPKSAASWASPRRACRTLDSRSPPEPVAPSDELAAALTGPHSRILAEQGRVWVGDDSPQRIATHLLTYLLTCAIICSSRSSRALLSPARRQVAPLSTRLHTPGN